MDSNIIKTENVLNHKETKSFMDIFKQFILKKMAYENHYDNYYPNDDIHELSDDNIHIGKNNFSGETKEVNSESLFKLEECEDLPIEIIPITEHSDSIMKQDITFDLSAEDTEGIKISRNDDSLDIHLYKDDDSISYHSSDFEFIPESEAKDHGLYVRVENCKDLKEYFDQGLCNENHRIPEGNEYLELFQGKYTPYPTQVMENKCTRARNVVFMEYNGVGFNMHGPKQIVSDKWRNEALLNENLIRNMYPLENTRHRRNYTR